MNDTQKLLQSCHRGTITAVNTLEQVMTHVQNRDMRQRLQSTLQHHRTLGGEIGRQLHKEQMAARDPGAVARACVWMTTEMRLMTDAAHRDRQIAHLVINGCNTGIQAVSGDVNHFTAAGADSRRLAASLVEEEDHLMADLRAYL